MFCPRGTFNQIRLTTGLFLLVLLMSGLRPKPASSAQTALPAVEQSTLSDQHVTYLPLLYYSWELVPARIYCIGDSLTDAGVYEVELMNLLGPNWVTVEMGKSADTTSDMLARFQTDVIDYGDAAYVIIWGGANDVYSLPVEESETSLQAMYTLAHEAGIKVVAVTITPLNSETDENKEKLLAINAWIQQSATNADFIADAYTAINDPDNPGNILPVYDSGDHAHLTTAGYAKVAGTIYEAVTWVWDPPE